MASRHEVDISYIAVGVRHELEESNSSVQIEILVHHSSLVT